ncbi:hypothetical protein C8J56DRAFT_788430, partial [Mycena floridula]
HYDRDLVVAHKVHLVGWPHEVPFCAPSTMTRSGDIRALLEALQCGSCHWTKVTREELRAAQERVDNEPVKPGKKRSDTGQVHVKKKRAVVGKDTCDDGSGGPARKKRRTGVEKPKAPAFLSPETIASDDDEN